MAPVLDRHTPVGGSVGGGEGAPLVISSVHIYNVIMELSQHKPICADVTRLSLEACGVKPGRPPERAGGPTGPGLWPEPATVCECATLVGGFSGHVTRPAGSRVAAQHAARLGGDDTVSEFYYHVDTVQMSCRMECRWRTATDRRGNR